MRQIVRKVKNGKEITFLCSKCGNFVHEVFIPIGKKYEDDWDKIPEKCSCGARLTNRQPIIDENETEKGNGQDIDEVYDISGETYKNIRKNIDNTHKSVRENQDIYGLRIRDLEKAISIDYFDMRLNSFKRSNLKIPDNVEFLRMECIKRNISYMESNMEKSLGDYENDGYGGEYNSDDRKEAQKRLNLLRQKYDNLLEKFEVEKM